MILKKIGIDIDDTIVNTCQSMMYYAEKFNEEVLHHPKKENVMGLIKDRYYLKAIFGWTEEEKFAFFNQYYSDVLKNCIMKIDALDVLKKLALEGYELYFITARLTNIDNCDTVSITKEVFQKYDVSYKGLFCNCKDKLTKCQELGIELFIDDSYETCQELESNGIKALFMTCPMNKNIKEENIRRVFNWYEIDQIMKEG